MRFLLTLILFVLSNTIYSQIDIGRIQTPWEPKKKHNFKQTSIIDHDYQTWLKFNIHRALIDEIPLYYEFPVNRFHSIELKAGYIYSNPVAQYIAGGSFFRPYFYPTGFLLAGGYRIYNTPDKYLQFNLGYKYKGYENKEFWTGGMSGTGYENSIYLSQFFNIVSVQINYGKFTQNSNGLIYDKFIGIGLNAMFAKTNYIRSYPCNINGCGVGPEDQYEWDNGLYWIPTLHIGLKLCSQLNKKRKE